MMEQEQHQEEASVISPDFCFPHPTTLVISKGVLSNEKYLVRDVNDSIRFRVVGSLFSTTRVILDASGRPIVTIRQKTFSVNDRRKVFRGESSDPKDLIFSTKISSLFQFSTKLHIFLASNEARNVCDYALKSQGRFDVSCLIYAGNSDSSTVIAQMKKKFKLFGNGKLMVSMNPNVDCAFIVALIIIFEETKSD